MGAGAKGLHGCQKGAVPSLTLKGSSADSTWGYPCQHFRQFLYFCIFAFQSRDGRHVHAWQALYPWAKLPAERALTTPDIALSSPWRWWLFLDSIFFYPPWFWSFQTYPSSCFPSLTILGWHECSVVVLSCLDLCVWNVHVQLCTVSFVYRDKTRRGRQAPCSTMPRHIPLRRSLTVARTSIFPLGW